MVVQILHLIFFLAFQNILQEKPCGGTQQAVSWLDCVAIHLISGLTLFFSGADSLTGLFGVFPINILFSWCHCPPCTVQSCFGKGSFLSRSVITGKDKWEEFSLFFGKGSVYFTSIHAQRYQREFCILYRIICSHEILYGIFHTEYEFLWWEFPLKNNTFLGCSDCSICTQIQTWSLYPDPGCLKSVGGTIWWTRTRQNKKKQKSGTLSYPQFRMCSIARFPKYRG